MQESWDVWARKDGNVYHFLHTLPPISLLFNNEDMRCGDRNEEKWGVASSRTHHTNCSLLLLSDDLVLCWKRSWEQQVSGRHVWGEWSLASNTMIPLTWLPGGYLNSRNSPNRTGPAMTWSPESLDSVLLGRFREICLSFSFNLFSVSGFREGKRWKSQLDSTATTGVKGSSKGVLIPNDHWQLSHHPSPASLLFLFLLLLEIGS